MRGGMAVTTWKLAKAEDGCKFPWCLQIRRELAKQMKLQQLESPTTEALSRRHFRCNLSMLRFVKTFWRFDKFALYYLASLASAKCCIGFTGMRYSFLKMERLAMNGQM